MGGHIVGLMHCINSISDPQGVILLFNTNIPLHFFSLVVFDKNKGAVCSKEIHTAHNGKMREKMKYVRNIQMFAVYRSTTDIEQQRK